MISLPSLVNKKKCFPIQSVFLIDEEGEDILAGGHYLLRHLSRGIIKQSSYWGQELIQYAHTHNFKVLGNLLEILWIDIHTTSDESEYITTITAAYRINTKTDKRW